MKRKIYKLWWIVLSSRRWQTRAKAQNQAAKLRLQRVEERRGDVPPREFCDKLAA